MYTHVASSAEPLTENNRESMTANVKSTAYNTLLSQDKNCSKFSNDQQIFNFASDDLSKNAATKIPGRLLKPLSNYMKSIGQISCGRIEGTCWLVTAKLVMTNHHVYRMFMKEREDLGNSELPIIVSFDYLYPGKRNHAVNIEVDDEWDPSMQFESSQLDYKFLRLKEDERIGGREPLGPIVRSRPLEEGLVIIVGHPANSEIYQETCVVVSSYSWRQKLGERGKNFLGIPRHERVSIGLNMTNNDLLRHNQVCLPYDTTLFSGASGSPVFDLNGNIVAMHTQGYPLDDGKKTCSLMEFGVQFSAICEDMRRRHVVEKYFPNHEVREMDMD